MTGIRVGFACVWDPDPRRTWSYSAWDLREALRRRTDVELVDVGIALPRLGVRLLQLASLRRRSGGWVATWEHFRAWEAASQYYLDRRAVALRCDAVIQIQDLGVLSTPYFVYQDFSYDLILDVLESGSDGLRAYFPHLDRAHVARRRERQLGVYARAAGVFSMSHFLRRSLLEKTGLPPDKVHTVHPGAVPSVPQSSSTTRFPVATGSEPRTRLLFAGTTFAVKGGDAVVAALAILRRRNPSITLSVVGPADWPLPGEPPEGVRLIGRVAASEMAGLYAQHDLLVVPSRFEGFGKVFVEALAHGLPCIARDAFAMPELIRDGENGALVRSENPAELAECIERVLASDEIYARCAAEREKVLVRFNWDRAAADMVAAIRATL